MRDDSEDLKKLQEELDVSVMEIAQATDLHPQTVYKVLGNNGGSRSSVNRVKRALSQMKERLSLKSKAVG